MVEANDEVARLTQQVQSLEAQLVPGSGSSLGTAEVSSQRDLEAVSAELANAKDVQQRFRAEHAEVLEKLKAEHGIAMEQLKVEHSTAMEKLKLEHEMAGAKLQEDQSVS